MNPGLKLTTPNDFGIVKNPVVHTICANRIRCLPFAYAN
jgi:hypothetical protein